METRRYRRAACSKGASIDQAGHEYRQSHKPAFQLAGSLGPPWTPSWTRKEKASRIGAMTARGIAIETLFLTVAEGAFACAPSHDSRLCFAIKTKINGAIVRVFPDANVALASIPSFCRRAHPEETSKKRQNRPGSKQKMAGGEAD